MGIASKFTAISDSLSLEALEVVGAHELPKEHAILFHDNPNYIRIFKSLHSDAASIMRQQCFPYMETIQQ